MCPSDNGLAPNRRQAIIWSNVGMLLKCVKSDIGPNCAQRMLLHEYGRVLLE